MRYHHTCIEMAETKETVPRMGGNRTPRTPTGQGMQIHATRSSNCLAGSNIWQNKKQKQSKPSDPAIPLQGRTQQKCKQVFTKRWALSVNSSISPNSRTLGFTPGPTKNNVNKLPAVYSHKTILHVIKMNDRDNFSYMDESHKWDFEQKVPDT